MEDLAHVVRPGMAAASNLSVLRQLSHIAVVREAIEASLVGDRSDAPVRLDSADAVLDDLESLGPLLRSAKAVTDAEFSLVEAAAKDVSSASQGVEASIRGDARTAAWLLGTVTVTSLVAAWLAARFIVTPLRRLARLAEALGRGEQHSGDDPGGPSEVRTVTAALNGAAGSSAVSCG